MRSWIFSETARSNHLILHPVFKIARVSSSTSLSSAEFSSGIGKYPRRGEGREEFYGFSEICRKWPGHVSRCAPSYYPLVNSEMPFGGEITSATAFAIRNARSYAPGYAIREEEEEERKSWISRVAACISRAFPFVRPSLSSARTFTRILETMTSARAGWLIRDARGQRRCARARVGIIILIIFLPKHESISYNEPRAKTRRLASRARNTKVSRTKVPRIIFLRSARSSFRSLVDFPASSESRDSSLDPVEAEPRGRFGILELRKNLRIFSSRFKW